MSQWDKHIFLHIPKTAGTTLTGIIQRNYSNSAIKELYNPLQFDADLASGLSDANVQMMFGHFSFDPALNPSKYYLFTFLREPISRTISNYLHLKNSAEPQHKQWMKNVKSIEDFLQLKQAFNWQARHLSGQKFSADFGSDLDYSLEMAKENLERMNFVGLTERFEDSLLCLSSDLGWKKLAYKNQNVQRRNEETLEILEKHSDYIAAQNKLDIALYEMATKLFENKLAEMTILNRLAFRAKKLL